MPDTRKLYALTFAKDHHGPAEILVNLPNGGRKVFNKYQVDDMAIDFAYAELLLDDEHAEAEARELAGHGLTLIHIKKPRHEADEVHMAEPPNPPEPPAVRLTEAPAEGEIVVNPKPRRKKKG